MASRPQQMPPLQGKHQQVQQEYNKYERSITPDTTKSKRTVD
jgi:hypothetical protein